MKKLLIGLAATAATFVAVAPASAQSWANVAQRGYGYPGDRGLVNRFSQQIAQQEQRIERSAQRRLLSPSEYRSFRAYAQDIRRRLNSFARDGLSRGEIRDIEARLDRLRERVREERSDNRRNRSRW